MSKSLYKNLNIRFESVFNKLLSFFCTKWRLSSFVTCLPFDADYITSSSSPKESWRQASSTLYSKRISDEKGKLTQTYGDISNYSVACTKPSSSSTAGRLPLLDISLDQQPATGIHRDTLRQNYSNAGKKIIRHTW